MDNEKTLNEEFGLGPEWTPVENHQPVIPSHPYPFPLKSTDVYFAGSIPPSLQHDSYFVQTGYLAPSVASSPLMPVAQAGQPANNAGVQQTIRTVTISTPTIAGGQDTAVQFNFGGGFGGDLGFTYNKSTQSVFVGGNLVVGGDFTIAGGIVITGNVSVTGFINTGVGFRVGGLATSGRYLRGNGTNFVSAVLSGSDIAAGLVPVGFGGTGADLSATGGANQVVQQSSSGGAFTVGQLSASALSNGVLGSGAVVLASTFASPPPIGGTSPAGGNFTSLVGTTAVTSPLFILQERTAPSSHLAGFGIIYEDSVTHQLYLNANDTSFAAIPSGVGTADLTGQTAAKAATTLYTPVSTGRVRISAYLKVTTVDGTSSTLGAVTITFTDGTDSVAQSMVMLMADQAGAAVTTNTGNSTTSVLTGSMFVYAKTGVAIQYAIAYVSNTPGQMAYAARLTCEAL